jgi:hypothetical protein
MQLTCRAHRSDVNDPSETLAAKFDAMHKRTSLSTIRA